MPAAGHELATSELQAEMEAYNAHISADDDSIAGLTSDQAEAANFALEQRTSESPELLVLEDDLAELSAGTRAAIGRALAKKPHVRHGDLFLAISDQLSLEQAVEFKKWQSNLPGLKRDLFLEWADGDGGRT